MVLLSGCSLKKQAPIQHTYLVEATRGGDAHLTTSLATLRVREISVAAPFEGRNFVYRNSELNYESDFYHEFLVPPRALLTGQVRQWLAASGLFRAVLGPTSKADSTHHLEGSVGALYADFRNHSSPKAVVAIEFLLFNSQSPAPELLFHRSYREEIPAAGNSAEALAKAWSQGLAQILAALERDLEKVDLRAAK